MKYVGNISVQKEDIQYVVNAVTNDNSYVSIDTTDVVRFLEDDEKGLLIEASCDEYETHSEFFSLFFERLSKEPKLQASKKLMIALHIPQAKPLSMVDLGAFQESLDIINPDVKLLWGLKKTDEVQNLKITVVIS